MFTQFGGDVGWGIIGCGQIAEKFVRSLAVVSGAHLLAVASKDAKRAQRFAEKWAVARAYDSYRALLESEDIHAVYIATTHNFHFDCVRLALSYGKAVLCEKPLTISARQCRELMVLADRQQCFLMEAMWSRFLPAQVQVRRWLAQGEIGEVKQIRADFGFDAGKSSKHRLFDHALAGGALLDTGIYPVSFASMVMQGVQPAKVIARAQIGDTGVDEQSFIFFEYADGEFASLSCAITASLASRAEIVGSEGCIRLPTMFFMATEVELINRRGRCVETFSYPEHEGFRYQIEEVMACLRRGDTQSQLMPLNESLEIMTTMDNIRAQIGLVY